MILTSHAVDLHAVRDARIATARVQSVWIGEQHTLLSVDHPGGEVKVSVPTVPLSTDYDRDPDEYHPLAVQIRVGRAAVECDLLITSTSGPRRTPSTIGRAIALAESGVHAVIRTD